MNARRWILGVGALVVLLVVASVVALFFIDEPLRRYTEAKMNANLKGYTVTIGRLHFSPINFSLDLRDLLIVQNEHPDPPVARIDRLYASVHWRALLHANVVGDILIDHPVVVLNLGQASAEAKDETPVKDKGWQDALQSIYPLEINELRIREGDITYQDRGPFKPLRVYEVEFKASNIRNVRSEEGVYPSPMTAQARIFDEGSLAIDGWADFLAEPYAAVMADIRLDRIALDFFKPIADRYHVSLDRGMLSANGQVEISPTYKSVKLWDATMDDLRLDYVQTAANAGAAKEATRKTVEAAEQSQEPGLEFRVDRLAIVKSDVGYVNKTTNPAYRVFIADTNATLTNLSSLPTGETAVAEVSGKFMNSGPASLSFKLLPPRPGPDFDMAVQIDEADLRRMNDLLRAYGKFDVVAGRFSLYTELRAKDRQISGYVKPLFQDMQVYDPSQDRDKNVFRKAYEAVVGKVSKALENRPRDEVATRVDISGRIDNPNASLIDTIVGLVQNAFFKAILPGFDAQVRRARR